MKREDLEHIIRAAADLTDDEEIIVIGSQAILGQFPHAPAEMLVSIDADIFPKNFPDRGNLIDGSIGELSPFHATFGYYAHGVGESTAILPAGWKARLIPIRNARTRGVTGWCLEAHDLMISKYVAGREKDRQYTKAAAQHGLANSQMLLDRLNITSIDPTRRQVIQRLIQEDFNAR